MQPNGEDVLVELEQILREQLGDGPVRIPYATWLWQATVR